MRALQPMSSWLQTTNRKPVAKPTLVVRHLNSGFFSCCSVLLDRIIAYFNRYKKLPTDLNTVDMFEWYKPPSRELESIKGNYFLETTSSIAYREYVHYEQFYQYQQYKSLKFKILKPFIDKYFRPSVEVQGLIRILEHKYELDYPNICVLFYRGNDKITETPAAPYQDYINRARAIEVINPNVKFLVQSDETDFIEAMMIEFGEKAFFFKDETRHIRKSINTVDKTHTNEENFFYSKYYLAITIVMSKAKYVICGSGNCSIWICLYRGNANWVQQFLKTEWIQRPWSPS